MRRLSARYLLVLSAIAALMVIDQAVLQPLMLRLGEYAPAVNLAGRQRMLSQKLTKEALQLQHATPDERQPILTLLASTLVQWSTAHETLQGRPQSKTGIAEMTPELRKQWANVDLSFRAMASAAGKLMSVQDDADHTSSKLIQEIVTEERRYLTAMDRLVSQLEGQARLATDQLRNLALTIALTIIGLLLGLGWFVVRPATRQIRYQVDDLEFRVAERTRELQDANQSLQHEMQERRQAELRTHQLTSQLAHAARVSTVGHLTTGLAHELNQPLAAVVNYAETCDLLLEQPEADPALLRNHVDQLKRSAMRAGAIVRRIRGYVRPQAAEPMNVRLEHLLAEVAEFYRTELEDAEVCLVLEPVRQLCLVHVDPIQIQQVVVNLIQNAIQAMSATEPSQRCIRIRIEPGETTARVSVQDTGQGFADDQRQSAFAPFETSRSDGLGIGLSLCRSLIKNHEGAIWIESSSTAGSTICFTLPLREPDVLADRESTNCVRC